MSVSLVAATATARLFSIFLLMSHPASAASPGSQEVATTDMEIHYSVTSTEALRAYPAGSVERTMHGGVPRSSSQRHVMVAVLDRTTKKPITDAIVTARVAELAQAGEEKKLEPMVIAGAPTYGNYFTMKGHGPFHIAVTVVRPKHADKVHASFDYTAWDR
jgi:hypothetical protein